MDCKIVKDKDGNENLVITVPLATRPWPLSSTGKTHLAYSSGGALAVQANGYPVRVNLVVMSKTDGVRHA
mgnify:CR=1 FL=1